MKKLVLFALFASLSLAAGAQPLAAEGSSANLTAAQKAALKKRLLGRLSEKQKATLNKLSADLQGMKKGSEVTPEQKQAVKESLGALTEGATKPDSEAVKSLSESVTKVAQSGTATPEQKQAVTESVAAVLSSANISKEETEKALSETKKALDATNLDRAEIETFVGDLKAVVAEMKGSTSKLKVSRPSRRRR